VASDFNLSLYLGTNQIGAAVMYLNVTAEKIQSTIPSADVQTEIISQLSEKFRCRDDVVDGGDTSGRETRKDGGAATATHWTYVAHA